MSILKRSCLLWMQHRHPHPLSWSAPGLEIRVRISLARPDSKALRTCYTLPPFCNTVQPAGKSCHELTQVTMWFPHFGFSVPNQLQVLPSSFQGSSHLAADIKMSGHGYATTCYSSMGQDLPMKSLHRSHSPASHAGSPWVSRDHCNYELRRVTPRMDDLSPLHEAVCPSMCNLFVAWSIV